jgi:hypothetical protein
MHVCLTRRKECCPAGHGVCTGGHRRLGGLSVGNSPCRDDWELDLDLHVAEELNERCRALDMSACLYTLGNHVRTSVSCRNRFSHDSNLGKNHRPPVVCSPDQVGVDTP